VPVLSSYVGDHAALPRMLADADVSTLLKCLASGKKSIEQLRLSAPRQSSGLELLVVYCFRILLVYLCALYYGMLILSRALGACPTPPGSAVLKQGKMLHEATHFIPSKMLTNKKIDKGKYHYPSSVPSHP